MLLPNKMEALHYDRKPRQGERRGFAPSGAFRPTRAAARPPLKTIHRMVFLAFRPLAENMPKGMFSGRCGPPPGR